MLHSAKCFTPKECHMKFPELVSFARSTILLPEQRIALFHAMIFLLISKEGFELSVSDIHETIYINRKYGMYFHFYSNGAFLLEGRPTSKSKLTIPLPRHYPTFKRNYRFGNDQASIFEMNQKIQLLVENIYQNVTSVEIGTSVEDDDFVLTEKSVMGLNSATDEFQEIAVEFLKIDNMKDLKLWLGASIKEQKSLKFSYVKNNKVTSAEEKTELKEDAPVAEPQVVDLSTRGDEGSEDWRHFVWVNNQS